MTYGQDVRAESSAQSEMDETETDMLNVKLVVVGGAPEGDEFPVQLPCILGRSKTASIPLPHPLVSRRHCELFDKNGQLRVRDLGSTNGTFVGSERVDESTIHDGDLLTIGTVTFRAIHLRPTTHTPETPRSRQDSELETASLTRIDTGIIGPPVAPPKSGPAERHGSRPNERPQRAK